MSERENWIKKTTIGNDCVELVYVEIDKMGVYVVKETMTRDGTLKEKKRDIVLDFPIEMIEMKPIKELNSPYGEYNQRIYRININGTEYIKNIRETRALIQKKVKKQPFYTKYGYKFKAYINIALRSQERKIELREGDIEGIN